MRPNLGIYYVLFFFLSDDLISEKSHRYAKKDLHTRVQMACKSCPSCSPLLTELENRLRKYEGSVHGDRELKQRSLHIDVRRNSKTCTCKDRDCKGYLSHNDMLDARETYWGLPSSKGPNRSERRKGLQQLYTNAHLKFLQTQHSQDAPTTPYDQFVFEIGSHIVCEKAFLYIMFLPKKGRKIASVKRKVLREYGVHIPLSQKDLEPDEFHQRDNPKYMHACGYIRSVAEHCGGFSAYADFDNTVYVPYPDISYFYHEYNYFCIKKKLSVGIYAAESWFRRAWTDMAKEHCLKLSGGRGSHSKCAVCANAEELLRVSDSSSWSSQERDIVLEFRRMHIFQQMKEREYLEMNIFETNRTDPTGQPTSALILIDAMTCVKGDTPHRGMENVEDSNHVTSRLFGAEVHCGHIHETFLYYLDNMTSGGANVVVQIMREG